VLAKPPGKNSKEGAAIASPAASWAPFRLFNIGSQRPMEVLSVIEILEKQLGKKAQKIFLPMQLEEVPNTCADSSELENETGFKPRMPLEEGIRRFLAWYREYYHSTPG
jgi:UDP-glucuronate 4-epimerase